MFLYKECVVGNWVYFRLFFSDMFLSWVNFSSPAERGSLMHVHLQKQFDDCMLFFTN
jgi:hypothetical protein